MSTEKNNTEIKEVIGYKGFDANLKCGDMQYVIGETHEMPKDKILSVCPENGNEGGLHFCENPLDVFRYYEPAISRFAEVKSVGDVKRKSDDSDTKIATTKLHVSVELSLHSLIERAVKFIFERTTATKEATNTEKQKQAINSGSSGAASNSGYRGAASNSGYSGAAMSIGRWSKAETSVANSFACALGIESKAKGALNSWIVISEWKETETSWVISDAKCFKVDGIEILADTFYILKNGKPCILG